MEVWAADWTNPNDHAWHIFFGFSDPPWLRCESVGGLLKPVVQSLQAIMSFVYSSNRRASDARECEGDLRAGSMRQYRAAAGAVRNIAMLEHYLEIIHWNMRSKVRSAAVRGAVKAASQ